MRRLRIYGDKVRAQQREEWCGPAAIQNALFTFGMSRSQKHIAKLAGTNDDGSDHFDMMRALTALRVPFTTLETNERPEAQRWLRLAYAMPLLLCVDKWKHWVAVAGMFGDRYMMIDSDLGDYKPKERKRCARVSYVQDNRILRRWRATRAQRREGGMYYGIGIIR